MADIVKVDPELYSRNYDYLYDNEDSKDKEIAAKIEYVESEFQEINDLAFYVYSGEAKEKGKEEAEKEGRVYEEDFEEAEAARKYCESKHTYEETNKNPLISDREVVAFVAAYFGIDVELLVDEIEKAEKFGFWVWPDYVKPMKALGLVGNTQCDYKELMDSIK